MVTQPRMPCYKLALRFQRDDMPKLFTSHRRSGFYFSVIEEGELRVGSVVEILSRDPNRVTVADVLRLYLDQKQHQDEELLQLAVNVQALPENWKAELMRRQG